MKLFRRFAVRETLFGAVSVLVLLLVPSYGQQETDPSWYDPWAGPSPVVARYVQPRVAQPVKPKPVRARVLDQHKKPILKREPRMMASARNMDVKR
jgi:hypothetical protein